MNLDQNEGLFPEAVAELHIVTDLALSATKQAAFNQPIHGGDGEAFVAQSVRHLGLLVHFRE